ncbi:MAG: DUF2079 domain-containing protein [Acidimicrobiales bacterium]
MGWVLLVAQLLVLLVFSAVQYQRGALTKDFAGYAQAWWAIGHGHPDPFSTVFGVPFWRNNAELAMWPLALLARIAPSPLTLLWVQDIVVVLTEVVAWRWVCTILQGCDGRRARRAAPMLALGAAAALAIDPWVFDTVGFDFHFEAFAALFALLVARDLWAGRLRRLWCWVPLALVSTVLGGVYLVGVGLSGILAGRRTRRSGGALVAVGLVWGVLLTAVGGAGVGSKGLDAAYGYLVGRHQGRIGLLDIVAGVFLHPGAAAQVAGSHLPVVLGFLVVVGLVGVASPWGLGMALAVFVPNVLDARGLFIRYPASFQSWPALPFVLVGSIMIVGRLLDRGDTGRKAAHATLAMWGALTAVLALAVLPNLGALPGRRGAHPRRAPAGGPGAQRRGHRRRHVLRRHRRSGGVRPDAFASPRRRRCGRPRLRVVTAPRDEGRHPAVRTPSPRVCGAGRRGRPSARAPACHM